MLETVCMPGLPCRTSLAAIYILEKVAEYYCDLCGGAS